MKSKVCCVCKVAKPLVEFHRDKSKKDGRCSTCRECACARSRRWQRDNQERSQEYNKQYYQENKEEIKARVRRYRAKNAEECRKRGKRWRERNKEYLRQYRQDNRERRRENFRRWYLKHRDRNRKRRAYHRRYMRTYRHIKKARKLSLPHGFTEVDRLRAIEYFSGCCAVCGRALGGLFHTAAMDHWVPLSSNSCPGTIPTNMVPLCHGLNGCNNSKHNKEPQEWLRQKFGRRKAVSIHQRIKAYFEWVSTQ